jgi:hypothetical protein
MKVLRTKQSSTLAIHERPMTPIVLHTSKLAGVRGGDDTPKIEIPSVPSGGGMQINPFEHGG